MSFFCEDEAEKGAAYRPFVKKCADLRALETRTFHEVCWKLMKKPLNIGKIATSAD